jgi:glutathione synthase/RimK-type ligase-like ATP-grasp enzyme
VSKDQIVIVTRMMDPHTDDVIVRLRELGEAPIRLNTEDLPGNAFVTLNLGGSQPLAGSISIRTNGRRLELERVRSVWWRRPGAFVFPSALPPQEEEFASTELNNTLSSVWASLDCYWISYPENIIQASWKLEQLHRAVNYGLDVPRTLVTTDPEEVSAFYESCDRRIVLKVMSDPYLGSRRAVEKGTRPDSEQEFGEIYQASTRLVSVEDLAELDTVATTPCLFQEYIDKRKELRLTVIGDELFAAEIDSQSDEAARVDWRHKQLEVQYSRSQIPTELAERCMRLVRSYRLNFSAIDMILTPEGQYVFLENNPNGQFLLIESMVPELRMKEALAACLIRGGNS